MSENIDIDPFYDAMQKDVTDLLFSILHHYGRMHYTGVFSTLLSMFDEVIQRLADISEWNIFCVLKTYPDVFDIRFGELSATKRESAFDFDISSMDGKMAALLQVFLQDSDRVHLQTLKGAFKDFCVTMRRFIASWHPPEQKTYFLKRPAFRLLIDGTVEAIFMYRRSDKVAEQLLGKFNMKQCIRQMERRLRTGNRMHYSMLIDNLCFPSHDLRLRVSNFFFELSELEKFWFFRNQPKKFYINSSGYVVVSADAQRRAADFFLSKLRETGSVHYTELCQMLRNSSSNISEFFCAYSETEKINFFLKRPNKFLLDGNLCISAVSSPDSGNHGRKIENYNNHQPMSVMEPFQSIYQNEDRKMKLSGAMWQN